MSSSESLTLAEAQAGPGAGGEPELLTQRQGHLDIRDRVRVTRRRGDGGHRGEGLHQGGGTRARHRHREDRV